MALYDFGGPNTSIGVTGTHTFSNTVAGVGVGSASPVTFTWSATNATSSTVLGVTPNVLLATHFLGGMGDFTLALAPGNPLATRFSGTITLNFASFTGSADIVFQGTAGTETFTNIGFGFGTGSLVNTGAAQVFTSIRFINTTGNMFMELDSINTNINCFLDGTAITTAQGDTAVEDMKAGDVLLTDDGRETVVKWVGQQRVETRLVHPKKVNPICISIGALGEGLPTRDLCVSQDHAIAIDGMLINAGALVNGTTIYQVQKMPLDGFTYYHVETDAHELLLAEGVAAETFIDYAGRDGFENGQDAQGQIAEMDLPRISSARLLPDHLRTRLSPIAVAAE